MTCVCVCVCAQENSKKLKMKFPTKIPNRKTKCKTAKTANSSNLNESLDILRLDPSLSLTDTKIPQYQRAAAGSNQKTPKPFWVLSGRCRGLSVRPSDP